MHRKMCNSAFAKYRGSLTKQCRVVSIGCKGAVRRSLYKCATTYVSQLLIIVVFLAQYIWDDKSTQREMDGWWRQGWMMTDRRRIKREREAQVNVLLFAFLEPIRLQDCSPIKALTLPRKTALKIQKKKKPKKIRSWMACRGLPCYTESWERCISQINTLCK